MRNIQCTLSNGDAIVTGHNFASNTQVGDLLFYDYTTLYFAERIEPNGDLVLDRGFEVPSQEDGQLTLIRLSLTPAHLANQLGQTHRSYLSLFENFSRYITDLGTVEFEVLGRDYSHKTLGQIQTDVDQQVAQLVQAAAEFEAFQGQATAILEAIQSSQQLADESVILAIDNAEQSTSTLVTVQEQAAQIGQLSSSISEANDSIQLTLSQAQSTQQSIEQALASAQVDSHAIGQLKSELLSTQPVITFSGQVMLHFKRLANYDPSRPGQPVTDNQFVRISDTQPRTLIYTYAYAIRAGQLEALSEISLQVPDNPSQNPITYFVYLDSELSTYLDTSPRQDLLLGQVEIPAANTEDNDPYLAQVSHTLPELLGDDPLNAVDVEQYLLSLGEDLYRHQVYVPLPTALTSNDYQIRLEAMSYDGSRPTLVAPVSERDVAGFTIHVDGLLDNACIAWALIK